MADSKKQPAVVDLNQEGDQQQQFSGTPKEDRMPIDDQQREKVPLLDLNLEIEQQQREEPPEKEMLIDFDQEVGQQQSYEEKKTIPDHPQEIDCGLQPEDCREEDATLSQQRQLEEPLKEDVVLDDKQQEDDQQTQTEQSSMEVDPQELDYGLQPEDRRKEDATLNQQRQVEEPLKEDVVLDDKQKEDDQQMQTEQSSMEDGPQQFDHGWQSKNRREDDVTLDQQRQLEEPLKEDVVQQVDNQQLQTEQSSSKEETVLDHQQEIGQDQKSKESPEEGMRLDPQQPEETPNQETILRQLREIGQNPRSNQSSMEDMMACLDALDAAFNASLLCAQYKAPAFDHGSSSSNPQESMMTQPETLATELHQVTGDFPSRVYQADMEKHAKEFMEAAQKLQRYFAVLQHQNKPQPSRAEQLRKEIAAMEEELKIKDELIQKKERQINGWRKQVNERLDKHKAELDRV